MTGKTLRLFPLLEAGRAHVSRIERIQRMAQVQDQRSSLAVTSRTEGTGCEVRAGPARLSSNSRPITTEALAMVIGIPTAVATK